MNASPKNAPPTNVSGPPPSDDARARRRPRSILLLAIAILSCGGVLAVRAEETLPPADYVRFATALGCIAAPLPEAPWPHRPEFPGSLIEEAENWHSDGRLAPLLASVELSSDRFFQILDLAQRDAGLWTDLRPYLFTANGTCS